MSVSSCPTTSINNMLERDMGIISKDILLTERSMLLNLVLIKSHPETMSHKETPLSSYITKSLDFSQSGAQVVVSDSASGGIDEALIVVNLSGYRSEAEPVVKRRKPTVRAL
ncbi:hypothetical protein NDU88_005619 [Pleurodeles waltl]|uniref:Uncharacterized protein n=1 Tax=Pleurodeles waltl TaxID=8319 RepID=A0AAV7VJI0_PLEWA|nr:hypothetical protein NDU88_005619 [Pleurodeles waltl]